MSLRLQQFILSNSGSTGQATKYVTVTGSVSDYKNGPAVKKLYTEAVNSGLELTPNFIQKATANGVNPPVGAKVSDYPNWTVHCLYETNRKNPFTFSHIRYTMPPQWKGIIDAVSSGDTLTATEIAHKSRSSFNAYGTTSSAVGSVDQGNVVGNTEVEADLGLLQAQSEYKQKEAAIAVQEVQQQVKQQQEGELISQVSQEEVQKAAESLADVDKGKRHRRGAISGVQSQELGIGKDISGIEHISPELVSTQAGGNTTQSGNPIASETTYSPPLRQAYSYTENRGEGTVTLTKVKIDESFGQKASMGVNELTRPEVQTLTLPEQVGGAPGGALGAGLSKFEMKRIIRKHTPADVLNESIEDVMQSEGVSRVEAENIVNRQIEEAITGVESQTSGSTYEPESPILGPSEVPLPPGSVSEAAAVPVPPSTVVEQVASGQGVGGNIIARERGKGLEERTDAYHKEALTVYFNSWQRPQWDNELEKNIYSADFSSDKALRVMKGIVFNYGPDILVSGVKTEGSIDELVEILELFFSLRRNMARGPRVPIVGIPLDQLLGLSKPEEVAPVETQNISDPFVEAATMGDTRTEPSSGVNQHEHRLQPITTDRLTSPQIPFTDVDYENTLVKAWNNRKYTMGGQHAKGPRTNQDTANIIRAGRIEVQDVIGPGIIQPKFKGFQMLKVAPQDDCED